MPNINMNKQFKAGLCIESSGSDSDYPSKRPPPKPVPAKLPPSRKAIHSDSKVHSGTTKITSIQAGPDSYASALITGKTPHVFFPSKPLTSKLPFVVDAAKTAPRTSPSGTATKSKKSSSFQKGLQRWSD